MAGRDSPGRSVVDLPGSGTLSIQRSLLEEQLAPRRPGTDHPHLRDTTIFEAVDERVVCIERSSVATEQGSLPLRGPALVRDREQLLKLHVSCSQIHDRANHSEEALDAPVVANPWEC